MSFFFDLISLQFIQGPVFLFVYASLMVGAGIYLNGLRHSLRQSGIQEIPRRDLNPYELSTLR